MTSLRTKLKVFNYGLFFFACDRTVSVLKLTKIKKVLEGTNTQPGSMVMVDYTGVKEPLEATLVAVEDNLHKLREFEKEFVVDPSNKHLFEDDVNYETGMVEEEDGGRDESEQPTGRENDQDQPETEDTPLVRKQKRKAVSPTSTSSKSKKTKATTKQKGPKKQKRAKTQDTAKEKPAPKTKKPKKPCTVIDRYEAGEETPNKENDKELETRHDDSSLPPESPSTPRQPQLHVVMKSPNPPDSIPSSPWYHNSPLPLIEDVFTPPNNRRQSGTPRQSTAVRRLLAPSSSSSNEMTIEDLESRLTLYIDTKFRELQSFLLSTFTMQSNSSHITNITVNETINDTHTSEQAQSQTQTTQNEANMLGISTDTILEHRNTASSMKNFAVKLVRASFTKNDLVRKNVEGVRGKQALDVVKLNAIKGLVAQYYPVAPMQKMAAWRDCKKAIDSWLRKLNVTPQDQ